MTVQDRKAVFFAVFCQELAIHHSVKKSHAYNEFKVTIIFRAELYALY